jgi:sugar phosphate isomerase/epimerase
MHMHRRDVLAMLAAAGLAATPLALARSRSGADARLKILKTWPMAMQLWTVFAQIQKDLPGTLAAVKKVGYDVVESAGLMGKTAAQFRKLLDDTGLSCRSAHYGMGELLENTQRSIDDSKTLGARWIVCASPQLPPSAPANQDWIVAMRDGMTLDAWKTNAEGLARIAPQVKQAGLTLLYHNHFMEFADRGGKSGLDVLLEGADPSLLRLQLDIGWVHAAGQDAAATLRKYAGRVDLLHVKDMVVDAQSPVGFRSVEVGRGQIDWKTVLPLARKLGVKGLFVEQEAPYKRDIFESLAISRDYLLHLR